MAHRAQKRCGQVPVGDRQGQSVSFSHNVSGRRGSPLRRTQAVGCSPQGVPIRKLLSNGVCAASCQCAEMDREPSRGVPVRIGAVGVAFRQAVLVSLRVSTGELHAPVHREQPLLVGVGQIHVQLRPHVHKRQHLRGASGQCVLLPSRICRVIVGAVGFQSCSGHRSQKFELAYLWSGQARHGQFFQRRHWAHQQHMGHLR